MTNRSTLVKLGEEFLLINLPIFVYVLIETHHKDQDLLEGLLHSPEWCIGTAVMSFQAMRLYVYGTAEGPKKSPGILICLFLLALAITASAFWLLSMHQHSTVAVGMKWATFGTAFIMFSLFGGAGLWAESHQRGVSND